MTYKKEHLFKLIDDQASVGFTGKINVLDSQTNQILGAVIFIDGDIINSKYMGLEEIKAFSKLVIDEFDNKDIKYIIEPELIEKNRTKINIPLKALKSKMITMLDEYSKNRDQIPPMSVKLLLNSGFINSGAKVNEKEFSLMNTVTEYCLVKDIYNRSNLLDHEITNALVSLRKKNAIKVVKIK